MKLITLTLASFLLIGSYQAQDNKDKGNHTLPETEIQNDTIKNKKGGHYYFTVIKDIESLDVQSQGRTGTCWSFSSLSFLESEIIRTGKKPVSLSEMFIARNA